MPSDVLISAELHSATRSLHRAASTARPIKALFAGELSREDHARLVGQQLHLYRALEDGALRLADDPVVSRLADPRLARADALAADLEVLVGADWAADCEPLPVTRRYTDRIQELVENWPPGYVAHHYVRYMGDLSGGQIMARILERHFGLTPLAGASFYDFDGIEDPEGFKEQYRQILDQVPWSPQERQRVIAEAKMAYEFNIELLGSVVT